MAQMVLLGVPPRDLPLMSFSLMEAVVRAENRRRLAEQGDPLGAWNPDRIPDYPDPDGPPDRTHFMQYGRAIGWSEKALEAEWARQVAGGGFGKLPF